MSWATRQFANLREPYFGRKPHGGKCKRKMFTFWNPALFTTNEIIGFSRGPLKIAYCPNRMINCYMRL